MAKKMVRRYLTAMAFILHYMEILAVKFEWSASVEDQYDTIVDTSGPQPL